MDKETIIEYMRWVDKMVSYHMLYYESGHIDDFKKWMEAEDMVKYIGQLMKEQMEEQLNQDVYTINLN